MRPVDRDRSQCSADSRQHHHQQQQQQQQQQPYQRDLGKMRSAVGLALFLAVSLTLWTALCAAAPRYEDDGKNLADRDIQTWREMTMQILQQLLRAHGDFGSMCHQKRNSEIINSLLGLPKTMTDAGRK